MKVFKPRVFRKYSVDEVTSVMDQFFSDTDRSKEDTLAGLEEIKSHAENLQEMLKADMDG